MLVRILIISILAIQIAFRHMQYEGIVPAKWYFIAATATTVIAASLFFLLNFKPIVRVFATALLVLTFGNLIDESGKYIDENMFNAIELGINDIIFMVLSVFAAIGVVARCISDKQSLRMRPIDLFYIVVILVLYLLLPYYRNHEDYKVFRNLDALWWVVWTALMVIALMVNRAFTTVLVAFIAFCSALNNIYRELWGNNEEAEYTTYVVTVLCSLITLIAYRYITLPIARARITGWIHAIASGFAALAKFHFKGLKDSIRSAYKQGYIEGQRTFVKRL